MSFSEEDFYYRRCTPETWNGYLVEGFVFPDVFWGTARSRGGKLIMSLLSSMFEAVAPVFDYRVVSLPGRLYCSASSSAGWRPDSRRLRASPYMDQAT